MTKSINPPKTGSDQLLPQHKLTTPNAKLLHISENHPPLKSGQTLLGIMLEMQKPREIPIQLKMGKIILKSDAHFSPGTKIAVRVITDGPQLQLLVQKQPDSITNTSSSNSPVASYQSGPLKASEVLERNKIASLQTSFPKQASMQLSDLFAEGKTFFGRVHSDTIRTAEIFTQKLPASSVSSEIHQTANLSKNDYFPPGSLLKLQLSSYNPPGSDSVKTIATVGYPLSTKNQNLVGLITDFAPDGKPMLTIGSTIITLDIKSSIPIGTQLSVSVVGPPQLLGEAPITVSDLFGKWQNFENSLRVIAQNSPTTHMSIIRKLPQPGPQLTASMLLFLYAMKNGGIRQFLGENASRILEANGNLLKSVEEDVNQPGRQSLERLGPEWRSFLIPFFTQSGVHQLKLHVDPDGEQQEDDSEKKDIFRFVIETVLMQLGQAQFEGRVHKRTVNLTIYSQKEVSHEMRLGIGRIFSDILSAQAFSGNLSYRQVAGLEDMPIALSDVAVKGISV